MEKLLIYVFPVIVNLVVGAELLIAPTRLAQSGANPVVVAGTLSVWALFTALCSFLVGCFLTEKNAGKLVFFSGLAFAFCFMGFLLVPGVYIQFLWLFLSGIATSLFCAPFQVFMKKVEQGRSEGIVRATALYSASWSFGMASGPFLVGMLWDYSPENGWKISFLISILLALLMSAAVRPLERFSERKSLLPRTSGKKIEDIPDYTRYPDWARLGWALTGAAFAAVAIVKSLFPARAVQTGISPVSVALIIAVIYYTHSATSFFLIRSRRWMYRPWMVLGFSILGFIGLSAFGFFTNPAFLFPAALLLGAYSGIVGFCLVFYSLVHPSKAPRYIAVNEVTVGICGVCGPLAAGFIADFWCIGGAFLLCLPLIFAAGLFHFMVSWRFDAAQNTGPTV